MVQLIIKILFVYQSESGSLVSIFAHGQIVSRFASFQTFLYFIERHALAPTGTYCVALRPFGLIAWQ